MLRKLLDLICPPVAAAAQLPYGLSRAKDGPLQTDVVRLLLPLLFWRGEQYQVHDDSVRHGWWLLTVMIAVVRVPGGADIRLRAGSWARGFGRIRMHRIPGEWYSEREYSQGRYVKV